MSIGYNWATSVPGPSEDRYAVQESYKKKWDGFFDIKSKIETAIKVAKTRKTDVIAVEFDHIHGASAAFEGLKEWFAANKLIYTFGVDPENNQQLILVAPE
jgi:hypothetical protein